MKWILLSQTVEDDVNREIVIFQLWLLRCAKYYRLPMVQSINSVTL